MKLTKMLALVVVLAAPGYWTVAEEVEADVAGPTPGSEFHWSESPGIYSELRHGDRPVLRYMYEAYDDSSPQNRERTYKVYHHVFSPDGIQLLTKGPGGLYPHHRGLFYGFNKVTYGDDQTCDTWHCKGKAHQSHVRTLDEQDGAGRASHRVAVDWHGVDGEVFAHEERELTVHDRSGGTLIDFVSRLATADGRPIHLDGDPQHAGFQFRAAQEVAAKTNGQTYYLRTDGKGQQGGTRNWEHGKRASDPTNQDCTNRPWNAMSIVVDGQRYTIVYLDHPDNPKPARYSERDYGRFGSYFVADVTSENPLEIRYRIWVQEGEMTVEKCEALSHEFTATR